MCHSTDFAHLIADAAPAAGITDHPFDPDGSELDACCLTCAKLGWTTLSGDHASDYVCPVCGGDADPIGPGCACYGDGLLSCGCVGGAFGHIDSCTDEQPDTSGDEELDDARARWIIAERSRLLSLSGLPLVEDALAFARSLR